MRRARVILHGKACVLFSTFHWGEFSPVATPNCKGVWEMQSSHRNNGERSIFTEKVSSQSFPQGGVIPLFIDRKLRFKVQLILTSFG